MWTYRTGETFRTVFYGSSAIYAVHITDEAIARASATANGTRPTYAYEVSEQLRKLAAPRVTVSTYEEVDDDEQLF